MQKRSGVKKPGEEPLFPMKAVIVGLALFLIYARILFSLDPEWVMWAGPMVLGGALYVPNPPPDLSSSPQEVFQMASFISLFSLFTVGLLIVLRGEPRLGWLSWLKAAIKGRRKGLAKAQNAPGTTGVLDVRVSMHSCADDSLDAEGWKCPYPPEGEERLSPP